MPAAVSCLIPAAAVLASGDVRAGQEVPALVWQVLSTVEDHRAQRGRRHELVL